MTGTVGANTSELRNLGLNLNKQIDVITEVMGTVDGVLNSTTWTGPARERFVQDWNGSFKQALGKLNEAFGSAGKSCTTRAEELDRLMN